MPDPSLLSAVSALCDEAESDLDDTAALDAIRETRMRLHDPLRVAIAGRVKAGKSTLLNALVGERLAPTDAGECTKIPTWYRWGRYYEVTAIDRLGGAESLAFTRPDGALEYALPPQLSGERLDRIDVAWPSARLKHVTLIDTPGIGSTDTGAEERTLSFFSVDRTQAAQADAVIYLLRHVHRTDADFLEAFTDQSVGGGSPVNAIGVLSRADEVGAGRIDAMVSARAVAGRYAVEPRLRQLVSGCIAVSGLLAETAATLTEDESAAVRSVALLPADEKKEALLSADHFLAPDVGGPDVLVRRNLLLRLGMFGIRYAVDAVERRGSSTASELARELEAVSGIADVRAALQGRLLESAALLKSSTGLASLRAIAMQLGTRSPLAASDLLAKVEQLAGSAHGLAELRLLHAVRAGDVEFTESETAEIERVLAHGAPAERLGLSTDSSPDEMRSATLQAVSRWRERAGNPVTPREVAFHCLVVARTYEGMYATLSERD